MSLRDAQQNEVVTLMAGELFGLQAGSHLGVTSALAKSPCTLASLESQHLDRLRQELPALNYLLPCPATGGGPTGSGPGPTPRRRTRRST